jgi:hypothetical protein
MDELILWQASAFGLSIRLYADASADISTADGAPWRMGCVAIQEAGPIDVGHVWLRNERSFCEAVPGRFVGECLAVDENSATVRYALLGHEREPIGWLIARYQLGVDGLGVRVLEVDEGLPSLCFPPPLEAASLVLPQGVGRWVRRPLPNRYVWLMPINHTMRWFGGLAADEDAGWLAIFSAGWEDAGVMAQGVKAAPVWLKCLNQWTTAREVRYVFTRGGYVGQALVYRQYARATGLHRTLADKQAELPAVGNLIGGRILALRQAMTCVAEDEEDYWNPAPDAPRLEVSITHRQALEILTDAKALGMARGALVLRGWIPGGYDYSHPDVWPPEPALGEVDVLRAALAATGPGILSVLHDNYQDIYRQSPSYPHGIVRLADGQPLRGGLWAGGRAYILTARAGLDYAHRNWPALATLGPTGMMIDTTTTAYLYQSAEPGHEETRQQNAARKRELLQFFQHQGVVVGSEEAGDFGMSEVAWLENRHRRTPGESIPLWPLVFHDAAVCGRYALRDDPDGTLPEMLWGYAVLWNVADVADWQARRSAFAASLRVDDWHARVGGRAMTAHRFLSPDGQVEQTEFGTTRITVNFGPEPFDQAGRHVPARGYVIEGD